MGPYIDDNPYGTDDRLLQAARDSFGTWDIIETFGGYLAVPKGGSILQATTVDGLVAKLRRQEPCGRPATVADWPAS